ncbi:MAG: hypothetical protein ACSLFP_11235 [Acidimicrobiales bacterium]
MLLDTPLFETVAAQERGSVLPSGQALSMPVDKASWSTASELL